MKLLIVTQSIDKNNPILGFFHRWVEEFAKHFEFIVVICLEKDEYDLPSNVKILSLGKESNNFHFSIFKKIKYIWNFYKYIWQERKNYDAVFVHMNPIYVILGGLLWKILHKKSSLWYVHKSVDFKLRIAVWLVNNIFTASKESFRLNSKKVSVVGHGIDTVEFSPTKNYVNESTINIITVGRVTKVKNLEVVIDTVEILKNKGVTVKFEIIGGPVMPEDKEYLLSLKKTAREKGVDDCIVFLGEKTHEQIKSHLLSSGIFINMSYTGSLDKAVLEAMACEIPVITSNEAYIEMLKRFDLIAGSKDANILADKILYLFTNISEARSISKSLREIVVKEHNLSVLIRKLVEKI